MYLKNPMKYFQNYRFFPTLAFPIQTGSLGRDILNGLDITGPNQKLGYVTDAISILSF